jgi:mono/diheme cytochrome c family protein
MRARIAILAALSCCTLGAVACSKKTQADSPPREVPPTAMTPIGPIAGPKSRHEDPANPFAGDTAAASDGRRAFIQFNCYGCHGYHGGGGMGPSLRDSDWIYGGSPAQIFNVIARGGGNGMPSWGSRLSDSQMWQLVSYIETMAKDNETDPPR